MAQQAKAFATNHDEGSSPLEPTHERALLSACYSVNSTCIPSHANGHPQTKEMNEQKHLKCHLDNFIFAKYQ